MKYISFSLYLNDISLYLNDISGTKLDGETQL